VLRSFAVGLGEALEDLRPETHVVGIVEATTHSRRISAPWVVITCCGEIVLPSDFDIFRPCSSSVKPWVTTMS
jgi:hypothetical protein